MSVSSPRRLFAACILPAAAAAVALVAPGVAQATADLTPVCVGDTNIQGWGSTLQEPIQQKIWGPAFNSTLYKKTNCSGYIGTVKKTKTTSEIPGPKPVVTYDKVAPAEQSEKGSGAGMETWGKSGHVTEYGEVAFVGTDEGPSPTTVSEIESHDTEIGHGKVLETIPVVQAAVAIIVHLPAGCTSSSKGNTGAKGRLVLDNEVLEKVWQGQITEWTELIKEMGPSGSEDKLECSEKEDSEKPIKRVVRFDSSGTSNILKKYLHQIDSEDNIIGSKSWVEIGNKEWPVEASVVRAAASGTGSLLKKTAETAGSISYANLANVREEGKFNEGGTELSERTELTETSEHTFTEKKVTEIVSSKSGPGTSKYWVEIQNNGVNPSGAKYAEPSLTAHGATTGDTATVTESNCASTFYVNGNGTPFPPPSVYALWNEVTATTSEKKYPLCGMTFDLALKDFAPFGGADPFASAEAQAASDYLKFVVNPKGGQKAIKGNDYYPLPKGPVLEEAEEGAAEIDSAPF